jgi:hypothetical protein
VTRTKNAGMFGLLLLMLLMGCDIVAPDDQYQLGTLRSNWEWLKAQFGNSRFRPRRSTWATRTEPGFTYRPNILDKPQSR